MSEIYKIFFRALSQLKKNEIAFLLIFLLKENLGPNKYIHLHIYNVY